MLLPVVGSPLRRSLDDWFDQQSIRPQVVAEFADSALMKTFGQSGAGLFPSPVAIADEISRTYQVDMIGELGPVNDSYYIITPRASGSSTHPCGQSPTVPS